MSAETCPVCVLLVEDDERWREAIGAFLEDRGYPTALAEDEEQASQLLATIGRPCLVLLDLLTLHIDVSRLLAALGRNDRVATIPMVVVSVSAPELLSKPVAMKRPVDLEILFRIVQAHCCGGSRGGTKPAGGRRPLHGE